MSLKAVELQIAIPKTFDAGKVADQHQQNVIQQQLNASEAVQKEMERKQLTVNDTDPTEKITEEHRNSSGNESNSPNSKNKKKHKQKEAAHPYKGHFIDFSG